MPLSYKMQKCNGYTLGPKLFFVGVFVLGHSSVLYTVHRLDSTHLEQRVHPLHHSSSKCSQTACMNSMEFQWGCCSSGLLSQRLVQRDWLTHLQCLEVCYHMCMQNLQWCTAVLLSEQCLEHACCIKLSTSHTLHIVLPLQHSWQTVLMVKKACHGFSPLTQPRKVGNSHLFESHK